MIAVVSLVLARTYDFSSAIEPTQISQRLTATNATNAIGKDSPGVNNPRDDQVIASGNSESGTAPGNNPGVPSGQPGGGGSVGNGNTGTGGTGGGGETGTPGNAAPGDEPIVVASNAACTVQGRVTDDWGSPIVGVLVRATTPDGSVIETITDSRGRYSLPGAMPSPDLSADPGADVVEVSVILSSGMGASSSFAIMKGDAVISLTAPVSRAGGCERNFDTWDLQDDMVASPIDTAQWPDATSIYQYTQNAEELALSLGADLGKAATLQVQVWCDDPALGCDGSKAGAFFVAENELEQGSPPIIAMMPARSSMKSPGVPDNREYHEYGHYFLWLQTDETFGLPPGDRNHGGYYKNSSTRDSFVEGFAEFYSMMVSRQIDGDDRAEIYTIGADYDLEADRLPWEAEGWWEEFAVAGLLLDIVDGDADYAARASGPPGVNVTEISTNVEPSGTIVLGKVVNTSPAVVRNADVTVRYLNEAGEVVGTQVTRIVPEIIAPDREGIFYAAPPAGLAVASATATLGGLAKGDDDGVDMGLQQLIDVITAYERADGGAAASGYKGVSNVAELRDALLSENTPLTGAFDDIFVNHGFFADLDGNRVYNPELDGDIGLSSRPVAQVGGNTYPAMIPRREPGAFNGSFVTINAGDAKLDAVIQISIPANGGSSSYAYVTKLTGSERVELAVPTSDQDAEVTIITAGKGYKPVIAFRVTADDFNEKVDNGTISELQITPVELEPGTDLASAGADESPIPPGIVGGILAVLGVVAALVVINRKWGRA